MIVVINSNFITKHIRQCINYSNYQIHIHYVFILHEDPQSIQPCIKHLIHNSFNIKITCTLELQRSFSLSCWFIKKKKKCFSHTTCIASEVLVINFIIKFVSSIIVYLWTQKKSSKMKRKKTHQTQLYNFTTRDNCRIVKVKVKKYQ